MRILLAGKNELACLLWESLESREGFETGSLTARSENLDADRRPSLRALLAARNIPALNRNFTYEEVLGGSISMRCFESTR